MTSISVNEKLSQVLKLFHLPNYNITSTTYLDLLLTHISTKIIQSGEDETDNEKLDLLKKWVVNSLELWKTNQKPCQALAVFTLKLIGVIGKNENDFNDWQSQDVFNKVLKIFNLQQEDISASLKMAFTTMLLNIIKHPSGRQWIIASEIWRSIVKYSQVNQTLYVTRECHKFVCQLLIGEWQNEKFCKQVIEVVGEPLVNNNVNAQIHVALEELYLDQTKILCTTLDLISNLLENTLFINTENNIPDLLEDLLNLEARVRGLFEACISTRFLQHVHKLWILLLFRKLKSSLKEPPEVIDSNTGDHFRMGLCYMQNLLLNKKYIVEVVKTNKYALIYWKKLKKLQDFTLSQAHKFEHQAIALMIMPLCVCLRKTYVNYDFFDMFVDKIFAVTCQPVQRLAYQIRDVMLKDQNLPIEQICKSSIEILLECIDIMDRDIAVMTFQSMCHVLKNYMPLNKYCGDNQTNNRGPVDYQRKILTISILDGDPIVDSPVLLSTLLHGLAVMTEKFQFKWPDCVETICVLSLAQEILNHTGTLPNLCVKALYLCKLAIQNFMPPNLALLVDCDSHMNGIGSTLFKRLHDLNWEVRDSVLEILCTIAEISEDKYPAFQELLLTHKFLQIAADIAMTDGESYVRASALKFIASSIRINKLWDIELSKLNLPDRTIKLFKEESEAIVRREAVTLIKELYVYRKWPKTCIDTMTMAMVEAAVLDLHWEVKVNALEYWSHFITAHFTDQGMLDGSFPNVTFSKEHRKIVALNDSEIKRRLNKALDEMAKQNCLGVLLITLQDESDFEVSKVSADIIVKLKSFLIKYKLNEPMPELNIAPKDSAIIDVPYVKPTPEPSSTNADDASGIIDDIVDADDANLLTSIYKNSMKMDEDSECTKKETLERISKITRQEFLQTILNSDIEVYIEERRRWLKDYTVSFDSVLDDIITAMNDRHGVNSMDCY